VKRVVVRPAAAADIEDADRWYESQRPGLGEEFLAALRGTQDRILEHPEAYPVLHRDTRRVLIPEPMNRRTSFWVEALYETLSVAI
jgi:plasmid stabilization system protein ParE